MPKKPIKLNKLNSKTEKMFSESHIGVLIEHFDGNIKLLAESQMAFREETGRQLDIIRDDLGGIHGEISGMHGEINGIHGEMKQLNDKFSGMNIDIKKLSDQLSAMEKEFADIKAEVKKVIDGKVDKQNLDLAEQRIVKLEIELGEYRKAIDMAKKS